MAIGKKSTKKEEKAVDHEIEVKRAKQFSNGNIGFDVEINGVTVYGCVYVQYADKKTGEDRAFISFPSRQSDDGKYYNHAYVKLSEKDEETIEKALEAMIE